MKINLNQAFLFYFYCLTSCSILVLLLPFWPNYSSLILFKYFLLFSPRWWLLLLITTLFIGWKFFSTTKRTTLFLLLLISLRYLDINLNINLNISNSHRDKVKGDLKVITVNLGEGARIYNIEQLLRFYNPDIILFQEAQNIRMNELFDDSWHYECVYALCISSKYPFKRENFLDRGMLEGWGAFAAFYSIKADSRTVYLSNIHFDTPHRAFKYLLNGDFNYDWVEDIEDNRIIEAALVSSWSNNKNNTIIAGDFNMPVDENVYREYFSSFINVLDESGVGFNYTKHTPIYGLRIDHILVSDDFIVVDSKVLESVGGDHLPVMTTLSINP